MNLNLTKYELVGGVEGGVTKIIKLLLKLFDKKTN